MTEIGESSDGNENSRSLSLAYEEGYKLWTLINTSYEPTNEKPFQDMVRKSVGIFEDCTRKVSLLGLFSTNEELEEVSTQDLKYLLLPALLGDLTIRRTNDDRKQVIDAAEVYFKDFIVRCTNYGVADVKMTRETEDLQQEIGNLQLSSSRIQSDLVHTTRQRDEKIKRYKAQKEMEKKILDLEKLMQDGRIEDETLREYYIILLKKWINQAQDELASIERERPLLAHMDRLKVEGESEDHPVAIPRKAINKRPLKPVIITKDAFQKKVYGLGYPSLPTLTVDEFVDQKFKDGTWEKPDITSLYARTMAGVNEKLELEKEEAQKERIVESDDQVNLARERNWDDWKDEHRRGFGNRKNMG